MSETAASILTAPAAASPSGQQPSGNGSANAPWFAEIITKDADPQFQEFVKNKNYPSALEALRGHYSAEKMIGLDKAGRTLVMPKDENDVEGRKAFLAKLGVPETPEGYKLPVPDGEDPAFSKIAATWMHANGVPPQAAVGVVKAFNDYVSGEIKKGMEQDQARSMAALADLKTEWGQSFDQKSEFGRRAVRQYGKEAGLDDNDLKSLESSLGTSKMLKLFSKLGEAGGEGGFAGGDGGAFSVSPAAAQIKINQFVQDRTAGKISDHEWRTSTEKEMLKLMEIAAQQT